MSYRTKNNITTSKRTYECDKWEFLEEKRYFIELRFEIVHPDVLDPGTGKHFLIEVTQDEFVLLIVAFEHDFARGLQR